MQSLCRVLSRGRSVGHLGHLSTLRNMKYEKTYGHQYNHYQKSRNQRSVLAPLRRHTASTIEDVRNAGGGQAAYLPPTSVSLACLGALGATCEEPLNTVEMFDTWHGRWIQCQQPRARYNMSMKIAAFFRRFRRGCWLKHKSCSFRFVALYV